MIPSHDSNDSVVQTRYCCYCITVYITNQSTNAFNIGQFVLVKSNLLSINETKLLITLHVHMKLRRQK